MIGLVLMTSSIVNNKRGNLRCFIIKVHRTQVVQHLINTKMMPIIVNYSEEMYNHARGDAKSAATVIGNIVEKSIVHFKRL